MSCMSILLWILEASDDRVVFTSHKPIPDYVTQQVGLVVEPTMIDNACGTLNLVVRGMP